MEAPSCEDIVKDPRIILHTGTPGEIETLTTLWKKQLPVVIVVEGSRCGTKARLLQEFAAALRFPEYFGGTWDSFEECLNDLEWFGAKHVVIVVTDSGAVLRGSPGDFRTFAAILRTLQDEGDAATARFVFHERPEAAASTRKRYSRQQVLFRP